MVTVSHNDKVPELLAHVRRGPFSRPTSEEKIEYLLSRALKANKPLALSRVTDYAMEHTLSYQRRVHAVKYTFLQRCKTSPLGITHDYWDRTEAQQRGSLHAHILVWFQKRRQQDHWQPLRSVPRTVTGNAPKQRLPRQVRSEVPHPDPPQRQEDSCYQLAEMGRVSAEMVRPTVTQVDFGGFDFEMLRIAALARTIQIRMGDLHTCTPRYCLKDRAVSRFFFPWPRQGHQCYDSNTERVGLQRRMPEDDQWVTAQ